MLEHLPHPLGAAMTPLRAGTQKTVIHRASIADCPTTLTITSPGFEDGAGLDPRFTADGEGVSPPLAWQGSPLGAVATVIVVEDADSPTPAPLVHLLAWVEGGDGAIPAGAFGPETADGRTGLNSFHKRGWLPPDPPPGHGPHRYLFQVFALDAVPDFSDRAAKKDDIVEAIEGHLLASGSMVGVYARS